MKSKSSKSDTEWLESSLAKKQCSSSTVHEECWSKYVLTAYRQEMIFF